MHDMDTTKRMFTHMINMMEQHDTMTISCGDPLIELLKDVRELLKEQEAKNVVNMTLSKDCFLIASCPKCNALLTRVEHKNYCGYCGQAVKWE